MKIVHFDVDSELAVYLKGQVCFHESLNEVEDTDILLNTEAISFKLKSKATGEYLSRFSKLKMIVTRTVGLDHIDFDYCKEKGIAVYHISDYGSYNIAEHTFALLLAGTRNILTSQKDVHKGIFSYEHHLGVALKGKKIGIVGTGKIGLEMIKRAKGFEMEIVAYDVFQNKEAEKSMDFTYVTLEELITTSDIISLHAPLLPETRHMIGEKEITKMKDQVILLNTGRGALIDTQALVKLLNKFRFVGLDVIEEEDSFNKDHPLLHKENVIITPHMAFYSDASIKIIAEKTMELINHFENGNLEGRVA